MDNKTWIWRKKSSEKPVLANDKLDLSVKGNEQEIQILLTDKAQLENDVKSLNEKLSSILAECNAKDDLVKKHAKIAQEATEGQKKADAEAMFVKQELDEALQQRCAAEERIIHLDAALKECMEQLHFVRQEQEQRIHDAVMKASREFEKSQMISEEKLAENSKRLSKLGVENTHVTKALLAKEKMVDDLTRQKNQLEAEFNALITRFDSTEKANASLKYEVRVLEKELEIRNEEREFNHRTADASHKQHLENVKKIAKLESECQRLRLLVRKRLPGPAALAKMKNEVEMLGRESNETRTKRLNSSPLGSMVGSAVDNSPDSPSKRIYYLTEQLCAMEEENKTLKDVIHKKANELQFSRTMYARAASKLSEVESQLEELSKGQKIMEPTRNSAIPYEFSLASMSDIGSEDKVSCAESRASTLISELEHFRIQRGSPSCKTVGASDINLMDDFVEMEKLAIVSVDKPSGSSHVSPDEANAIVGPIESESRGNFSEVVSREIVWNSDCLSNIGVPNQENRSSDILVAKVPGSLWVHEILKLILEQNRVTQRNTSEILDDIRVALTYINHPKISESVDAKESTYHPDTSSSPNFCSATYFNTSKEEKTDQQLYSDLNESICKIAELIEGILDTLSKKDGSLLSYKNSETPSGYTVRVFQWKTSELSGVLQQFVHACYNLLNKKTDFNKFAKELSTALDWTMNYCFSLQDVSSMRDAIKKHLGWDESRSENEVEFGMISQFAEADELHLPRENLSSLSMFAASNSHNNFFQKEQFQSDMREENKILRNDFINAEVAKKDVIGSILSADKNHPLTNQLQESEKIISNLQNELGTLRKSKDMIEDQVKNHKLINEGLDTQLSVARVELNEARQKFSSLEAELENKSKSCEELETTCLELQLQLESVTKNELQHKEHKQDEKQIRTDWEITAASEKLAECQETILNLGKQLKALASPREAALFDKVISTPTDTITNATETDTAISTPTDTITIPTENDTATDSNTNTTTPSKKKLTTQRSSLLDRMIAEDKDVNSPKTKEGDGNYSSVFVVEPLEKILASNESKQENEDSVRNSLVIVPSRKQSGASLWKRLFRRKKNVNIKKMPLPFPPQA
ncbi:hypothetical protein Pint_28009 [Pistacia integerrima]|uniref:Uncharacterized protein n=1 Tax=Pistacia integerrima TaxID=434235 RepID=A0ACC0YSQ2_9ROSI|nr:hypothetical protein Pint_28009 [Pistacia integerrima]